jgi:hypothetical protein
METNSMYVFIFSIPANYRNKENGSILNEMFREAPYVSEWHEGEVYLLHYNYFNSFNEAVIQLSKFVEKYSDIAVIIEPGYHSYAKMIIKISERKAYLYDVSSAFGFLLREKIDSQLTYNNPEL